MIFPFLRIAFCICLLLSGSASAIAQPPATESKMVFPEKEWTIAAPKSQQIDSEKLQSALAYLKSHCFEDGIDEVMIVRNGVCIFAGENTEKAHDIWSCTKSFTSTALGLLIKDGKCELDSLAAEIEPTLKPFYSGVTIRHFATMTSGYSAAGRSRWEDENSDWSWTPYAPEKPLFEPGKKYAYWDEAMIMFGKVLTKIADETLNDLLTQRIFTPIGMGNVKWNTEGVVGGHQICYGGTGIQINARQMARFGLLYLNRGNWNGRQLIPQAWVDLATRNQVPLSIPVADTDRSNVLGPGAYGYNWWVNGGQLTMPDAPERTYYASGLNHNLCVVVPEWNIVFVRMGVDGNPKIGKHNVINGFLKRLGEAMNDSP